MMFCLFRSDLNWCHVRTLRGLLRSGSEFKAFDEERRTFVQCSRPVSHSSVLPLRAAFLFKPETSRSIAKCNSPKVRSLSSFVSRLRNNKFMKRLMFSDGVNCASFYSKSDKDNLRVLGIESSCDDTGAAVLNGHGTVLGEAINSQTHIHLQTGGIIPNVAKEMHAQNMEAVVQEALDQANVDVQGLDAIAVTVKPGLVMSLTVGLNYAKKLAKNSSQYLIPIHHMEAHALTARMLEKIEFPFLVLLASGGHCLLALAKDIDDFLLLGSTQDDAPGEAFDKTSRELKLNSLPEFASVSGGVAMERMARVGDPNAFPTVHVMTSKADCNFSFCGLKIAARRKVYEEHDRLGIPQEEVLPNAADICAWFQHNIAYHIAKRLQRAFIFADMKRVFPGPKTLVLSGGVASNTYLRSALEHVCHLYDCQLICPPQRLCTDNGIMIAWNGVEKIVAGRPCFHEFHTLDVQARAPFGVDISKEVSGSSIKLPRLKLSKIQ